MINFFGPILCILYDRKLQLQSRNIGLQVSNHYKQKLSDQWVTLLPLQDRKLEPVRTDWAIYCNFGNFLKPVCTNLFGQNGWATFKGVKIFEFPSAN